MKIILSRKGFDSAVGGVPSPIFPSGHLRSLPIPSTHGIPLNEVHDRRHDLAGVVRDLTRGRYTGDSLVHLDPDLAAESLARAPGWRPLFGQTGAAQGHLMSRQVGSGDVFVFYGWFRQVEQVGGTYRYRTRAPDMHVIFGWLQIAAAFKVDERHAAPAWALYHPHFSRPRVYANDTVYLANERLALAGRATRLPGAGCFNRFHPSLCLTRAGASRSRWRLPAWWYPGGRTPLSYHRDPARWHVQGDALELQTAHQGQEFVLEGDEYPEAIGWLAGLLSRAT